MFACVPLLACLSLSLPGSLPVAASGDHLFIGFDRFLVHPSRWGLTDFSYTDLSGITAMASDATRLYAGDELGHVQVFALRTGAHLGLFQTRTGTQLGPRTGPAIRALTVGQNVLFVGYEDGEVRRLDPDSGLSLGSRMLPVGVRGLLVDDGFLFAAGSDGALYRASLDGPFESFSCACFSEIRCLGMVEGDVIAADQDGQVVRLDPATGAIVHSLSIGPLEDVTVFNGELLVFHATFEGSLFEVIDVETGTSMPSSLTSRLFVDRVVMLGVPRRQGPRTDLR